MLEGKTVAVRDLTKRQIEVMFDIMKRYYENILWENFERDLNDKCDAVLLCDENGEIHGFTTLAVYERDARVRLLYSGDTIVEKEYWGSNDLSSAWIKNALRHAERFDGKTYWLLLSKGYKTYKFLHTFFNAFYPCVDVETPAAIQEIMDEFAASRFGDQYQDGVYAEGKDFLKEEYDDVGKAALRNRHTAFFLRKNPNYMRGDELVCLTELCADNLNRLGRKMLEG